MLLSNFFSLQRQHTTVIQKQYGFLTDKQINRVVLSCLRTDLSLLLCPELTTRRIKGMVVSKSRIIEPNDQHKETFFNVDLVDKSGKEIRATAFKENLHAGTFEKYYDMFQVNFSIIFKFV